MSRSRIHSAAIVGRRRRGRSLRIAAEAAVGLVGCAAYVVRSPDGALARRIPRRVRLALVRSVAAPTFCVYVASGRAGGLLDDTDNALDILHGRPPRWK